MIQNVKLKKGQILTKQEITRICNSARSTWQYAKFELSNGVYIQINYNKDLSISISTNSRDLIFYQEVQNLVRIYTQMRVIDMLFRWLPKLRK